MEAFAHRVFAFADFRLDLAQGRLFSGDQQVPLRPKSFELLRYLVENGGRLVSKDELIRALWPDVTVSDESLTRCVSDIRAALSDQNQALVKTVPRRGYILDVPVSVSAAGAPAMPPAEFLVPEKDVLPSGESQAAEARWLPKARLLAALVAVAAVLSLAFVWLRTDASHPDEPSLAVLPFENLSSDVDQSYLGTGLAEDLATGLSKFPGLVVIARNSASRYKGSDLDLRRVGGELNAKYLLTGGVRRDGQRLRITAQLVEAVTARQLWASTYDRSISDLFGVYDEVTRSIIPRLVSRVTKTELDQSLHRHPETLSAYDLVLQGNAKLAASYSGDRGSYLLAARELFEKALSLDPDSAPATHGLAFTYVISFVEPINHAFLQREYQQPATADRALALARQAVALDGELADARTTLARILFWRDRRAESLAEYERAFALNPNLVEPRYSLVLVHDGRIAEAIADLERSMRLDPFYSPLTAFVLGKAHAVAGRYDDALRWLRISTSRMPNYRPGLIWRAVAASGQGLHEEARQAANEVLRVDPAFSVEKFIRSLGFRDARHAAQARDRLAEAGLPR